MAPNWFFAVTLLIQSVAWIIALVGQSIVTATLTNHTIGPLWLAILIQLLILLQLPSALQSPSSLQSHTPLLSSLLPISTTLAAIAIDANLYPPSGSPAHPSRKLTVAGWLITAILNCVWILALNAGKGTKTRRFFDILIGDAHTEGAGAGAGLPASRPVSDTAASAYGYEVPAYTPHRPRSSITPPPTTTTTKPTKSPHTGILATSLFTFTLPRFRQRPPIPQPTATSPHASVNGGTPYSPAAPAPIPPPSEGTRSSMTRDPRISLASAPPPPEQIPLTVIAKAQALYTYTRNPADESELSFQRGEVLDILDRSGKWWEARKGDGSKGIAPSNYLKLL